MSNNEENTIWVGSVEYGMVRVDFATVCMCHIVYMVYTECLYIYVYIDTEPCGEHDTNRKDVLLWRQQNNIHMWTSISVKLVRIATLCICQVMKNQLLEFIPDTNSDFLSSTSGDLSVQQIFRLPVQFSRKNLDSSSDKVESFMVGDVNSLQQGWNHIVLKETSMTARSSMFNKGRLEQWMAGSVTMLSVVKDKCWVAEMMSMTVAQLCQLLRLRSDKHQFACIGLENKPNTLRTKTGFLCKYVTFSMKNYETDRYIVE